MDVPSLPISKPLSYDSNIESRSTVFNVPVSADTEEQKKPDQFLSSGQAGQCISYLSSIFTPTYNYCPISLICLIKKHKNSTQSVKIRILLDSASNVTVLKRQVCEELKLKKKSCQLNFGSTGGGFLATQMRWRPILYYSPLMDNLLTKPLTMTLCL